MGREFLPLSIAVVAALSGCATVSEHAEMLSGSTWRLVEMQSMDDAQGTTRPGNPDLYTLEFDRQGTAFIRLDCNRGRAPWQADRADGMSGSLTFGPLSSTRALCGEASLGERLGQQLSFVRSYIIRDGRLNMSLMADGGILVWERTGS